MLARLLNPLAILQRYMSLAPSASTVLRSYCITLSSWPSENKTGVRGSTPQKVAVTAELWVVYAKSTAYYCLGVIHRSKTAVL
jgi:hypothetical protein